MCMCVRGAKMYVREPWISLYLWDIKFCAIYYATLMLYRALAQYGLGNGFKKNETSE